MGRIPQGTPADVDRAVAAARAAFEDWSQTDLAERGACPRGRGRAGGPPRRDRGHDCAGARDADRAGDRDPGRASDDDVHLRAGPAGGGHLAGGVGNSVSCRPRRRRGRDHALELSAAPGRGEGRPRAGGRLHGRAEAERGHPASAFILAEIIDAAGLPAGVFNLVTGTGPVVGEAIASHPGVDMVSFTGSTRAGRRVSELAQTVKPVALEGQVAERDPRRRRPRDRGHGRRQVLPERVRPAPH